MADSLYQKEYEREVTIIETAKILRNEPSSQKCVAVRNIRNSVPMMVFKETIALLKPRMADMTGGQKAEVYEVSVIVSLLHCFPF